MLRPRFLWKLYAGYVVLILLTTAVAGIFVVQRIVQESLQETHNTLQAKAVLLRDIAAPVLASGIDNQLQERLRLLGTAIGTRLTVVRADGTVLADSAGEAARMDNHAARPEIVAARATGVGTATRTSYTLGEAMTYLALPVFRQEELLGYVRTSLPVSAIEAHQAHLHTIVFVGAGAAALIGLLLGFFFARRVTRPLTSMTAMAALLAEEHYDQHVRTDAKDEIGDIAEAFNSMADNLRARMETISRDHNQLLAILGGMVEGVIAVDSAERVVHMNQAAGTILHTSPEGSIGKHIWEVTRARAVVEIVTGTIRNATEMTREARIVEQRGDQVIKMNAAPLRNSKEEPSGAVVVLHDVTELRRLENVRRDFVANVSHELKTPITTIKGFVETLRDGALDDREQAERFLAIVARHADRLHAIIEDLLSLSRLEQNAQATEVPRADTALIDVLQNAAQDCMAKAAARQVVIMPSCDATLFACINAPLVEQAIVNLLDNAINYSKAGSAVWLDACRLDNEVAIRVRDEGIGIPQEHLPRLFERFYRVEKARSRDRGGTGLGLAIVKHIAQAHGGRASVTSTVGQGSTFTLHLPVA
jgi:two-component system, OmpR family, phosphate regulon sensor histidine kinase PhoR